MSEPSITPRRGVRRTVAAVLGAALVVSALVATLGVGPVAALSAASGDVVFTTQPLGASPYGPPPTGQPGVPWSIQPSVAVLDGVDPSYDYQVTLSIDSSSDGYGNLSCYGGNTVQLVNGSASFRGCSIDTPGQGFVLQAMVFGSTGMGTILPPMTATSLSFNIGGGGGGIATQIQFTTQPLGANIGSARPSAAAGTPWQIQPAVAILDQLGHLVTSDNTTVVQLAVANGTPQTGGPGNLTCSGGTAVTAQRGYAYFTGCSIGTPGTAYQLTAATLSWGSTQVLYDQSLPFDIAGGAYGSHVEFVTQPLGAVLGGNTPSAQSGTPWIIQPSVSILNSAGRVQVNDYTSVITLSIDASSRATGSLYCSSGTSLQVLGGVARFGGCQIVGPGTGYVLRASAQTQYGPIQYDLSLPINITAAASSLDQQPSAFTVTPGQSVTITSTLAGTGAGGQTITFQGTNALHPTWTTFGSAVTNAAGVATLTVTPTFSSTVQSVFAGNGNLAPTTSAPDSIAVRAALTMSPAGTNSVTKGKVVTYTSTLKPDPGQGQRVQFLIYQWVNGAWQYNNQRTYFTNGASAVQLTWTWATAGKWYVRTTAPANAYYGEGFSPTSIVNVK